MIASGFLFRSAQEAKLATRSFFQSAAINLAEAGVEEGIFAVNTNSVNAANGWSLASGSSTDYVKSITSGLDFRQATGAIHIRIDAASSDSPVVLAAGVISIPKQPRMVRQIRVGSSAPVRLWSNSVVSKGNVTFQGSASIDGYDSSLGPWNAATNRNDRASVATISTVQLSGHAEIYGYVATGGPAPDVGSGGRIYGATSPANPLVDASRIRTDFNTNLTDATAPTGTAISLGAYSLSSSATVVLPRTGDVPGANGRYLYSATSLALAGSSLLQINGPVDIVVSGNVTVSGSAGLTVGGGTATDASLNLYSPGDISLGGNGMINSTTKPINASIWGTKPSTATQNISIGGTAAFVGTIYAPNANITQSGAADIYGALVGKLVTLSGGCQFHYDTQLSNTTTPAGPTQLTGTGSGYLRVRAWSELTAAPGSTSAFARDNRVPFTGLF